MVGKEGLVIALEPFEDSFRILKQRTKNLKCKILAINKGVWSENIKIPLRVFNDKTISCRIDDNNISQNQNSKIIACTTIDSLINEIKPRHLDMIKMDIEGAEIEALKGAVNTMEKYAPRFSIASYHNRNNQKTCFWVENFLKEKGYSVKTFFPPHLTTYGEKAGVSFMALTEELSGLTSGSFGRNDEEGNIFK
jgi:FkbM family methyltransferase